MFYRIIPGTFNAQNVLIKKTEHTEGFLSLPEAKPEPHIRLDFVSFQVTLSTRFVFIMNCI